MAFSRVSGQSLRDDLTSISGYAQLRYELTDKLRISVGVRHTNDEKKTKNQNFGLVGPEVQRYNDLGIRAPTSLMPDVSGAPKKTTFKATTPRVAIDYSLDDNVTFYVSASRGFKAGGFNTFQNTLTTDAFEPEFVWSYEAGAKARLLDNRVFVAGSIFFMDYESLQLNVFGIDGDFLPQVLNAGDAEISGLELELELDAFVSDELRIRVAAAYLDAEMTKSRTADPIFPELGDVDPTTGLNVRDLAGNRLPRAPKWKIAVSRHIYKATWQQSSWRVESRLYVAGPHVLQLLQSSSPASGFIRLVESPCWLGKRGWKLVARRLCPKCDRPTLFYANGRG